MDDDTFIKFNRLFRSLLLLLLAGAMGIGILYSLAGYTKLYSSPTVTTSSDPYESIDVWDVRGDDTVRFTTLHTYTEDAPKRIKWLGVPLMWKDTDMAKSTPLECTVIEHHVNDEAYRGQTYRAHSYLVESSQRRFGYSATFKVLPHVHITGTATRLLSIGMDPPYEAAIQTKYVLAVILPDGVRDITVTDWQPYKTLTYHGRTLYYYDARPITTHQSIHIAYTLTDTPATDVSIDTVIENSNP